MMQGEMSRRIAVHLAHGRSREGIAGELHVGRPVAVPSNQIECWWISFQKVEPRKGLTTEGLNWSKVACVCAPLPEARSAVCTRAEF
jgi:hypothetical protein